jgi:hypothetical protein
LCCSIINSSGRVASLEHHSRKRSGIDDVSLQWASPTTRGIVHATRLADERVILKALHGGRLPAEAQVAAVIPAGSAMLGSCAGVIVAKLRKLLQDAVACMGGRGRPLS